ncbi:MAG: triose-phosphate isomerase [Geminicoccaceae bacterium]|nr:MAG: triose-phosphate isomerase [Geminicoccaceae bacterium]
MALARPVVFGNWKMNGSAADGEALCRALAAKAASGLEGTLGVFPPAVLLPRAGAWLDASPVLLGAQDCHGEAKGAFTGDLAAPMLVEAGAKAIIVGHSERRQYHDESDATVRGKAEAAIAAGAIAVICIGETEAEYVAGETLQRLEAQLAGSVPDLATAATVVVAYEPVWAIGTGRTPTNAEITAAHGFLREQLVARFADGADFRLLYGGSVKASNAQEILHLANVDGALVGGASLEADGFWTIYEAGLGG